MSARGGRACRRSSARLNLTNALRAFEATARNGKMTLAADELGVTYGAISRQVRSLEEMLGVTLFEGPRNRLRPTEAAEDLLPSLTDAFDANLKLPTYVLALMEVGEAAGVMEEVLGRASVMLDGEVEDASDRMVQILEPLLLSLGGFAAAFVAVATFLPIIRLMTTF